MGMLAILAIYHLSFGSKINIEVLKETELAALSNI